MYTENMKRRTFLKTSGCGLLGMSLSAFGEDSKSAEKPNVLIIMTDQQFSDCMSCVMGDKYIKTPNMDALAANGTRFSHAYSPNPLCMPMRASMITGHFPHETGVQTNSDTHQDGEKYKFMGRIFKEAGYDTAYFGKWHISVSPKKKEIHGFDTFEGGNSQINPEPVMEFLRQKHEKPFLVFASFLTPHEICEWSRRQQIPGAQLGVVPPVEVRPPLRSNFNPPRNETDIMTHMRKSYQAHKLFPVGNYTEDDWRRQIWGYYRLIERADLFVGRVMQALRDSGQEENTIVVFLSDHGDCHGAHHWNQKTVFYDESCRVPFIVSWKGKTPKGVSDQLLNTGIDLIPTICDMAGVKPPDGLPGHSLKALAMGAIPEWKREYIVSQNHMIQCEPVDGKDLKPNGRMVRSDRYKYCLYSEGERRESLVDMQNDPGEMVNQAGTPGFKDALMQHRTYLKEFAEKYNDSTALEMLEQVKK